MRGLTTWFQPETRFLILLFKAVEEGSIFIKSSLNLIALTFVSVYIEDVKEKNQIPLYLKIKVPRMKSPLTLVKSLLAVAGVAAVSAVSAAPASAFSFSNIPGGDTSGDAYVNSFRYTVQKQGSAVRFDIYNEVNPADSSIFFSKVFFDDDDNNYLSAPSLYGTNIGEVSFSGGPSNEQLSQGGNNFTTNYAFSRNPGVGLQGGEHFPVSFRGNYDSIITALNSGALRIALQVEGLPNGQSATYISTSSDNTQNTPEPLTMLAAGAAVGFGTMFKKQRAQAQKAR
ncbi:PEP-CTERM sorting domain-containing protein [Microcoleus sp. OTE_8_concoct_300]|uniref:PEP-CTERM sorting domain-containing protein n=1 Tax=Microcoleus sp. OTE_8_concoct_300 TaxID=2964710 RepID=UPI00403F7C1B